VDWQRCTEQAKSRTRRCPDGTIAQAMAKFGVSLGIDFGRRCCRKAAEPSLFGGRSTRNDVLALRTARKRRWRAMVAVEVRETGRSIPIRDAMWSLALSLGRDGAFGVKRRSTVAQAADRSGPEGPGGTKFAQADGILGTVFVAPVLTRRDCMEEQRRGGKGPRGRGTGCRRGQTPKGKCTARKVLVHPDGAPSNRRATRVSGARNTVNPRVGSGMQQAHGRMHGGTRRGGVRPRGRTETSLAWQPWGRRKARVFREWTCRRDVDGGAQRIPREAAPRGRRSGVERASKGRRKADGARGRLFGAGRRSQPGESSGSGPKGQRTWRAGREGQRATPGGERTRNGKPTLDAAQGPSQPHGVSATGKPVAQPPRLPEPLKGRIPGDGADRRHGRSRAPGGRQGHVCQVRRW
jgi:hypothetical protein